MAEWIRYIEKIAMLILLFPLRIFPVKRNRVFLHNDLGQRYSDSPKAVAEYLLSAYPGRFQVVYSLLDTKKFPEMRERGLVPVRYRSLRYYYYAMTSQVFLTNSGGFSYLPLRRSQYVINTWHGGGAYKKCGIHMFEDTPLFRRDLEMSAKKTGVFLSSSARFTEVMSESMLVPRPLFWETGLPRNDRLIRADAAERAEIRRSLGVPEEERLILYAPTYRKVGDDYFKDSISIDYGIDPDRVCAAMERRFGGKWRFAFRLHPLALKGNTIPQGAMDLSGCEDMQDLLMAADAMINDFSSSMWDFMLTGRPCFTFATDLRHYIDTTELYTPVEEWPFPRSTDNDALEASILGFDGEKYAADCKRHYEALGGCETGQATGLVCERICQVCFGKAGGAAGTGKMKSTI